MVRIVKYGCSFYFKARFHVQILSVFEKEPESSVRQSLIAHLNLILSFKLPLVPALKLKQALNFIFSVKKPNRASRNGFGVLLGFYYEAKYKFYYRQFSGLIYPPEPKCIALWNGHRLPEQAIQTLAKKINIPVAHFENGHVT